jgi:hypothetical protein
MKGFTACRPRNPARGSVRVFAFLQKNSKVLNRQPDFVCVSGNLLPKRRKETALFATVFAATATKPPKSGKDVQVCR